MGLKVIFQRSQTFSLENSLISLGFFLFIIIRFWFSDLIWGTYHMSSSINIYEEILRYWQPAIFSYFKIWQNFYDRWRFLQRNFSLSKYLQSNLTSWMNFSFHQLATIMDSWNFISAANLFTQSFIKLWTVISSLHGNQIEFYSKDNFPW